MGPSQELLRRVRVDQVVMATKEYFTVLKAQGLEPHH